MPRVNPLGWGCLLQHETKQPISNDAINGAYLIGLAGSAIGALASLGTTWPNQHAQMAQIAVAEKNPFGGGPESPRRPREDR
jgi:hypothetical protein